MKQALKIMEQQHACELNASFSVTRDKQKLESLYGAISKNNAGEKRSVVQFLTINPQVNQLPASVDLAYVAATSMDQKVLWVDTTEKSTLIKEIMDQRSGVMPSVPQGSLSVYEVNGTSLYLLPLPKRQGDKATSEETIKDVLASLTASFDLIIIDGNSPIARPENLNFSGNVDGVVLAIEAERTRIPVVNEVKQIMETRGIDIIGTILNNRRLYIPNIVYKALFKS